ncbi:hypothetical protein MSPP1_002779 [Malassezia sp. CBS 17886]|nr:hypothetical protein MSPP1_002779 [Malassezia sp. CBS 17886]
MTPTALLKQVIAYIVVYVMRLGDAILRMVWRTPPVVAGVRVERIQIPSRDRGRSITAYKYTPEGATGALPVHLNWHGSGFVIRRLGRDAHMLSLIASRLQCAVLDCDYRKGPESKFPAAEEDAEDQAVLCVMAHPTQYDTSRITVGGSSAGGQLALAMCVAFGRKLAGCFALYPPSFRVRPGETKPPPPNSTFRSGMVLRPWMSAVFREAYTPQDVTRNARFCPILADVSNFPEHVLIACGDADTLFYDGEKMIEKIQRDGQGDHKTHAKFVSVPSEAHEFNLLPRSPESLHWRDRVYDAGIATLRAAHAAA